MRFRIAILLILALTFTLACGLGSQTTPPASFATVTAGGVLLPTIPPTLEPSLPPTPTAAAVVPPTAPPLPTATTAPPPTPTPAPTSTPIPLPTPTPAPQRIQFPAGATSVQVTGTVYPGQINRYVLWVNEGQIMTISFPYGYEVIINIYGADGRVLVPLNAGVNTWQGQIPATQDYFIDVKSVGQAAVGYTMQVDVPPLATPTPVTERIQFAPGATSAQVSGSLPVNQSKRYVLRVGAGQTMRVSFPYGNGVILVIWGEDGTVLLSDHAGTAYWEGLIPFTQDYYISVRSVSGTTVDYIMQVDIPPNVTPTATPPALPERIQFAPGATSAQVPGTVPPNGTHSYVLRAMAGQTMRVSFPYGYGVILIIWGEDGTVLVSDHAGTVYWEGQLPVSQDYYIDVRSVSGATVSYTLQVEVY